MKSRLKYTLTPFTFAMLTGREGELRCYRCKRKLQVNDKVVTRRSDAGARIRYCQECADRLNIV